MVTKFEADVTITQRGFLRGRANITAQSCVTDARPLPEIAEKMGVRGGVCPTHTHFFGIFLELCAVILMSLDKCQYLLENFIDIQVICIDVEISMFAGM